MPEGIAGAVCLIRAASHVTVFSGAGISVESGIPPFRGPGGLWSRVDPGFIEIDYFRAHPGESWLKIKEIFYDAFGGAIPNQAHFGVAALEKSGWVKAVITQNIDNLHQEAGSREVIEFHGNSRWLVCLDCQRRVAVLPGHLLHLPPHCAHCAGLLKPDFIFFGEGIQEKALQRSYQEASLADLFLLIGASGEVQPACQIPLLAKARAAKIIEINLHESRFTPSADLFLEGKATEMVSSIVKELGL
jgi:NAD-dependent deacetylase